MGSTGGDDDLDHLNSPLLLVPELIPETKLSDCEGGVHSLKSKVWVESKKLRHIVGPAVFDRTDNKLIETHKGLIEKLIKSERELMEVFNRIALASMNVITQAFAVHLGDVELAAFAIANTVIVGFNFGLLLGMASALETLSGQAFGAKQYHMLGIYLQRSWIVMFFCAFLLLPFYIFATPVLKLLGLPDDVAQMSGEICVWLIPLHFSISFQLPMQRFLQSQLKNAVVAYVALLAFVVHLILSWVMVYQLKWNVVGLAIALDMSWCCLVMGCFGYTVCGGCPRSWTGFSTQAFSGVWEFLKLSAASGVMLCLENWYYRVLMLLTGNMTDAAISVDALSISMTINSWEMMIPFAFLAATGVRVANELGAGNGEGAKFATQVSMATSTVIGLIFSILILIFNKDLALFFTSSAVVIEVVDQMTSLLAVTILLNSVQPVLSGVAIGCGWQSWVAYINLGCYYVIGLPLGMVLGCVFGYGVMGIWGGMIFGGTAIQTIILAIITARSDWGKEAQKATYRVRKFTVDHNPGDPSEASQ